MPQQNLDAYTEDAVTRDGRTVRIRPITPDDLDAMMDLWSRLSPETIRLRFFAPRRMEREQMRYFTDVDYRDRFALVAERGSRIVGVARFDRLAEDDQAAEFAVLVEDAEQGQGIGTALLRRLLEPARQLGITHFKGTVLRENRRMRNLLIAAGLEPAFASVDGTIETSFRAVPSERFLQSADEQDRSAAVAVLGSVLAPKAIAVVGASHDTGSIGGLVFDNLRRGRFGGVVYPVNATADVVQGVVAYPTVAACPTVPDVVIVCVPAEQVIDVVTAAAQAGTRAAVILSSGFGEDGEDGARRERDLLRAARGGGIRVVGPNCMGVLNATGDVRMNATLSTVFPQPGRVAFLSQSGTLGLALLAGADRLGLGLSSFISVGNKIDISSNDLIQYWESDAGTGLILLYLESFGNPRKFGRIARRVGCTKPIVAVKSGRSAETRARAAADPGSGARAGGSERPGGDLAERGLGAIIIDDEAVDALFAQAGVIRARTLAELFDVASILATQPLPSGRRIAIVTNGGGPGVLAADACDAAGLQVCDLAPETQAQLQAALGPAGRIRNPVELSPSAPAPAYGRALRALADDPNVDMLLAIFVPPIATRTDDVAAELAAARADITGTVPLVSVFMSLDGRPRQLAEAGIPAFGFPEDAAQALGHATRYSLWRRRPPGHVVEVTDIDVPAARAVVDEALGADVGRRWLSAAQTEHLLAAVGIPTARARTVSTPEEAAASQTELGGAVAVKLAAPVHKMDVGGVRLGLSDPDETAGAVTDMTSALRAAGREAILADGFVVQEMVGDGVEMVIGVCHHEMFGPVVTAGIGGSVLELLGDVSVGIHPLTDHDVDDMLSSLRGFPLLSGQRGTPPLDVDAVRNVIFRINALVEVVAEIDELDLNPVFVRASGVAVVDARIRLRRHERASG